MRWISEHREQFKISRMAVLLDVSKSGVYSYLRRQPSKRSQANAFLLTKIREIHQRGRKCYGNPRITAALRQQGFQASHNRVARLMRENSIQVKRRRSYVRTTDSKHQRPVRANVLNRQFNVKKPNHSWVGDISYVTTAEGWLFLAIVMDLYSRKIVGWSMSETMPTALVSDALDMALKRRGTASDLMFHSDRGSQYASERFQQQLTDLGIVQSMSRKGNCYDNACAESFFGSLKTEGCGKVFASRSEARQAIFEYIEVFYNRQRLHSTLGYLSPEQFELQNVS